MNISSMLLLVFISAIVGFPWMDAGAQDTETQTAKADEHNYNQEICRHVAGFDFLSAHREKGNQRFILQAQDILEHDDRRTCWKNAIKALAVTLELKDYRYLVDYMERPKYIAKGNARFGTYMIAIKAIGVIAGRYSRSSQRSNTEIVDYLIACSDELHWQSLEFFMKDSDAPTGKAFTKLAYMCTLSLGITNSAKADRFIDSILKDSGSSKAQIEAAEAALSVKRKLLERADFLERFVED